MKKVVILSFVFSCLIAVSFAEDGLDILSGVGFSAPKIQEEASVDVEQQVQQEGKVKRTIDEKIALVPKGQEFEKAATEMEKRIDYMKHYQDERQKKQKNIELLKMDLEEVGLELKKKNIEREIKSINGTVGQGEGSNDVYREGYSGGVLPQEFADIRIVMLLLSSDIKKAILRKDEIQYKVKEGDRIPGGIVKRIETDGVVVVSGNGVESKISY